MSRIHGLMLPVFALAIVAMGAGQVTAQRSRGLMPRWDGDLASAQFVEVRDRSGQVILHGALKTTRDSAKELEREADLMSPVGEPGKGDVDIEISRKDGVATKHEIEVEVEHLPALLDYEVFVDGRVIGSLVTSKKGKGELELEWKGASSR
ncbi:MAG TPA: hypothetical protein VFV78_13485 [Vicinamibacterales bacterium]|nr:hypothetical protein [Vicinamibacterales bacterium]